MSAPRIDSNLALAKAMGSRRGYDPMPPSQHEWQAAEGEPPLQRLWSWMCAHTVRNQAGTGELPRRSEFAVNAAGRALTLIDASRDLEIDLGQLSKIWYRGEEEGLWRKAAGKGRQLLLCGEVKATQVAEANKRRQVDCTVKLTPADLLKINKWAPERKTAFYAIWEPAQQFRKKLEAHKIAEARATFDEIEHSIREDFSLDKVRGAPREREKLEIPLVLAKFVQSTSVGLTVHETEVDGTGGEERGETLNVQPAHLYIAEKSKEPLSGPASQPPLAAKANGWLAGETRPPEANAELRTIANVLFEEWGAKLKEVASEKLCGEIRVALRGAPVSFLRTKLIERRTAKPDVKSMGLALPLAIAVGLHWEKTAETRSTAAKRGKAKLDREAAELAGEILAEPAYSPQQGKHETVDAFRARSERDAKDDAEAREWARGILAGEKTAGAAA